MKDFIVPGCLAVFTIVIGWIGRIKAKAEKADIEAVFDEKIKVTMKPVSERIEKLEETTQYFTKAINSIEIYNKLAEDRAKTNNENLLETMREIKELSKNHGKEIGELTTIVAVLAEKLKK